MTEHHAIAGFGFRHQPSSAMKTQSVVLTFGLFLILSPALFGGAIPVKISPEGNWQRDGKPYFIRGAGGYGSLEELKKRGGNSIRTWSDRNIGGPDGILEHAHKIGLTVCFGVWLEPECQWFSYKKPEDCEKQKQRVLKTILEHRDHPALLCWGIGNEVEGDGENEAFWHQLNRLARVVKEADPAHPTFTAVAGFSKKKIIAVNQWVPDLDFIGINTYAALGRLRESLQSEGWKRPWVVTEYGARGFWESPRTSWGVAKEQTSTEKAVQLRDMYQRSIEDSGGCGGGYAFNWGWKQEYTGSWFSLYSRQQEAVTAVDVLEEMWTGKGPENRSPELIRLKCPDAEKPMVAGTQFKAETLAHDADEDPLTYTWIVRAEDPHKGNEGRNQEPPTFPAAILKSQGPQAEIAAPSKPGNYRLYLEVRDGKSHLATANVPFRVEAK